VPISVVLLVIGSALAHAAWNAILKRTRDPENAVTSMMLVAAACSVGVALVLRVPAPSGTATAWCLVSGVLEAGYFVTLARALSRASLGSVYTVVRGGALVVVWPVSVFALGEPVNVSRATGTLLVVLGLSATGAAERIPIRAATTTVSGGRRVRSGLVIAALCALFVSGYHLAYKVALSIGGRPEAVVSISLSTATLLNLAMVGERRRLALAAAREQPLRIVVGGLLGGIGFLVFLSAMKNAGAGVVLTLRNTSILFAQGFSLALGERPRRLGIFGAVLVTAGAIFLAR
jgi:drug/metabolite transporter (DMT)-like permease